MDAIEVRKADFKNQLAAAPKNKPDLLPSISSLYARKVAHLSEALNYPDDRQQAETALRSLIEKIVLTPGAKRGEIEATLYGELGTILNWTERQAVGSANKNTPGAGLTGVSLSMVAVTRNYRFRHLLQIAV
jgi:hypothetical protein